MGFWWWVLVYVGIAVVALILYALLGLSLWRKTKVLMGELGRLSAVAAEAQATMAAAGGRPGSLPSDVGRQAPVAE